MANDSDPGFIFIPKKTFVSTPRGRVSVEFDEGGKVTRVGGRPTREAQATNIAKASGILPAKATKPIQTTQTAEDRVTLTQQVTDPRTLAEVPTTQEKDRGFEERIFRVQQLEQDIKRVSDRPGIQRIRATSAIITTPGSVDFSFRKGFSIDRSKLKPAEERGLITGGIQRSVEQISSSPFQAGQALVLTGAKATATAEALTKGPETRERVKQESLRAVKEVESKEFSFLPGGTPITQEGVATLGTASFIALTGTATKLSKTSQPVTPKQVKVTDFKVKDPIQIKTTKTIVTKEGTVLPKGTKITTSKFVAKGTAGKTKFATGGRIDVATGQPKIIGGKPTVTGFARSGGQIATSKTAIGFKGSSVIKGTKLPKSVETTQTGAVLTKGAKGSTLSRVSGVSTTKPLLKTQFAKLSFTKGTAKIAQIKPTPGKTTTVVSRGLAVDLKPIKPADIALTGTKGTAQLPFTKVKPISPSVKAPSVNVEPIVTPQIQASIGTAGLTQTAGLQLPPLIVSDIKGVSRKKAQIDLDKQQVSQLPKEEEGLVFGGKQVSLTKADTIQAPKTITGTQQQLITTQQSSLTQSTPLAPAPSFIPRGGFFFDFFTPKGTIGQKKKKRISRGQLKSFTPSLTALTVGFKGKRSGLGELTGLGIRPIPKKKKKKRRR